LHARQNFVTSASSHSTPTGRVSNYTGCQVAYYPNNSTFATEGAVQSRDRIQRLQYNTITANNQSFLNEYGLRFKYSLDPLWFDKMKVQKCTPCFPNVIAVKLR
jgi:hypothetical protein